MLIVVHCELNYKYKNQFSLNNHCIKTNYFIQKEAYSTAFVSIINLILSFLLCLQQERLDIEEKYSSLQDEVAGKTKKLKRVWTMLMQAKSEVSLVATIVSASIISIYSLQRWELEGKSWSDSPICPFFFPMTIANLIKSIQLYLSIK